jgi:hypothetical protein
VDGFLYCAVKRRKLYKDADAASEMPAGETAKCFRDVTGGGPCFYLRAAEHLSRFKIGCIQIAAPV